MQNKTMDLSVNKQIEKTPKGLWLGGMDLKLKKKPSVRITGLQPNLKLGCSEYSDNHSNVTIPSHEQ